MIASSLVLKLQPQNTMGKINNTIVFISASCVES